MDRKTVRKDHYEQDIAKYTQAAVGQYDIQVEKSKIGGRFPEAQRAKSPEEDKRGALDPNLDATKKVAPSAQIVPEHYISTYQMLREIEEMKLGPASHDPSYRLTERRPDFGVKKIHKDIYTKTDDKDWQEGTVLDLYPEKPKRNRLVFKYREPVTRTIDPKPEEGRWVFYDVDLDAVREELAKDVFIAGRMEPEEFRERQEFKRMLEEHIKRTQDRKPEAGDYDQPRGMADNLLPGVLDFEKMMPRPFLDDRPEGLDDDLEGDVLILDPEKLGKRLPDIKFDKMRGREELKPISEEEELILEPLFDLVRKKTVNVIGFDKQLGRPENRHIDDDEIYAPLDVNDDPIPYDPSVPRPIVHSFGHGGDRFVDEALKNKYLVDEPLILDPQYPSDRPVKTGVNMGKAEPRFVDKLPSDPFYDDQPLNELNNDLLGALNAVKAEPRKAAWAKQSAGDKNKDLKQVMKE